MIEAYRRQYESDAFYRGLVADEKRRRSNVTVRVLLNSDARELSAIGPTRGFDEVAVSVDVNLYWMDEVLKAMKKYKPTIPSNVRGLRKNAVVFFFHTEKSRMAMKKNFHEVLVPAIDGRVFWPPTETTPGPPRGRPWRNVEEAHCIWTVMSSRKTRRRVGLRGTATSTSTCCAGPSTEASRWCLSLLGRGTTEARGRR